MLACSSRTANDDHERSSWYNEVKILACKCDFTKGETQYEDNTVQSKPHGESDRISVQASYLLMDCRLPGQSGE